MGILGVPLQRSVIRGFYVIPDPSLEPDHISWIMNNCSLGKKNFARATG